VNGGTNSETGTGTGAGMRRCTLAAGMDG
jgi:hypothetical protein